jgi:hypothetical protein
MGDRANFKINPANALGIDADETRAKLIALALSKPENYYSLCNFLFVHRIVSY